MSVVNARFSTCRMVSVRVHNPVSTLLGVLVQNPVVFHESYIAVTGCKGCSTWLPQLPQLPNCIIDSDQQKHHGFSTC
jgi:hypothetical protein